MTIAVQLAFTFEIGDLVRLRATFTREPTQQEIDDGTAEDEEDWQPLDPDTVTFKTKDPNGDIEQYDYLGSPPDDVVRDELGEFHLDITPAIIGTWKYRVEATGNGQSASAHTFQVVDNFA